MKFLEKAFVPGRGVFMASAVIVLNIIVGIVSLSFIVYENLCDLLEKVAVKKFGKKNAATIKGIKIGFLYFLPLLLVAITLGYQASGMLLGCYGLYRLYSLGANKTKVKPKRKYKWN